MGTVKKHGGVVPVDLRQFPKNISHRVTAPILKTPLPNSTLEIDFAFMLTDRPSGGR
jgi:hypothetical protein